MSLIDCTTQTVVEGAINEPPAEPADGQCFLVTDLASGDWTGKEGKIAIRIAGAWHYIEPFNGMAIYDRVSDRSIFYNSGWASAAEPAQPSGGNIVDLEARQAISALIQALRIAGIFPRPEQ
ncbi:DUF2793 domain-containing protein [Erythrobacter rubeus]|uniref:DUF2793 domain-containing protein n=1 Tax=Erythrobacter rubeus TaxID=2760803 RepID=A0ABR8KTW8_9SPHN|nr:DUF2793 domain-containing protein [Erythrobacter rubeus]MBD2843404.1 DUF2793 domain-containing protein [Erythrobacter rubeus]